MCVCISICLSKEARHLCQIPSSGVKGGCELSDVGAGNWTWILQEQYLILSTEAFSSPMALFLEGQCRYPGFQDSEKLSGMD